MSDFVSEGYWRQIQKQQQTIERQAAQIEMMREALGYRIDHPKVITALSFTPDQALEQFAERVREQCAKVCDTADKSTHPADLANALRAIKELP